MPQQPAASRPGAVPHVLLPAATARSGGQGGAQAPAGAPLQHTALRKTPWKKTFFATPEETPQDKTSRRRAARVKGHPIEHDTLWNECEDLDLDESLKRRVEALLANPTFLAWLEQQPEEPCP